MPDDLLRLPASDDEAASWLTGRRFGLPKEYFVAGMEPGVEARVREAVAAIEAAGATVEEVSLPHTDYGLATYYIVAPAEASANLARYDGVRFGYSVRGGDDYLANYLATRGTGFGAEVKRRIMLGTYALSAGYYDAFYVKAQKVRTLIKRDFDRLWEAGFDALVAPTSPSRRVPLRGPHGRPGPDVPVRRVHAAGQHGRLAGDLRPVRALGRAAGRAAADRRGLVRGLAAPGRPRLRGRSPPARPGGGSSPQTCGPRRPATMATPGRSGSRPPRRAGQGRTALASPGGTRPRCRGR